MTHDAHEVITTAPERRHIARVLTFAPHLAPYINWQTMGEDAVRHACDFDVRYTPDRSCTVTHFWTQKEGEE